MKGLYTENYKTMMNTCKPMADSCQCMAKNYYNIISNQPPIKINKFFKKRKKE